MSQDRSRIQDILSDQLTELHSISALSTNITALGVVTGDILTSVTNEFEYDGTYFVSNAGDNSDGLSWATAFTAIASALDLVEANYNAGEKYLILLGIGTFDVNVTGNPTYASNIHIKGSGFGKTIIVNNHVGATSILRFTGHSGLEELMVYTGATGSKSGVIVSNTGISAYGFVMKNVWIIGYSADGAMDCLLIEGGAGMGYYENVHIIGDITNSVGIHMDNSDENTLEHIIVFDCCIGIYLEHTNDDDNHYHDVYLDGNAVGIQIDLGDGNCFNLVHFGNNVVNVIDNGNATKLCNICLVSEVTLLMPETASAGTTVVSKNIADTYGDNYSQIDDGSGFTKPFKIIGAFLGNPSDNTATYIVKIATGEALAEDDIGRMIHQSDKFTTGLPIAIQSGVIPAGTRVSANCQTENAVADDIEIWLLYVEY